MKTKLPLKALNGGGFNCLPAREVELEDKCILCNDVTFPWESHPHKMRAFVIGEVFGPLALVWASHEQEAFDVACDEGLLEGLLIDNPDDEDHEHHTGLGNASELHNLDNAWIQELDFEQCSKELLCNFAERRGGCLENFES